MNAELIHVSTDDQGALVVSSLDFAQGLGIQHKNLLDTIRTHQEAIEQDFGRVAFETTPAKPQKGDSAFETRNLEEGKKGTKPFTVAYLTEDQALFVGTLSRNSKRVVEFKSTLVKSFAEARKRLQPAPSTTEQVLIQLISQSNQLLAAQQQQLAQLRQDVDQLQAPKTKKRSVLVAPHYGRPRPVAPSMRQAVNQKVNEYCGWHGVEQSDTYNYLYKRLQQVYGISVWRFNRLSGESLLDTVERYGHLDKLYSLVCAELAYPQE